ncbi:hypothetical protein PR202_ga28860 [Eleusine coracana subsp. coracana]|uniref:Fungal lipase-type domain-containing protein n=1 Tax=Eleusine coracana subsp. coracana TaxID=191504 RepID=A0AAV5DJY6_ELECO|nr:hypothetical protein PR202_ga28860 [Eleusine coracana subsp. coracana]
MDGWTPQRWTFTCPDSARHPPTTTPLFRILRQQQQQKSAECEQTRPALFILRFMERWRCIGVVALLLVLPAASGGRVKASFDSQDSLYSNELHLKNKEQSFAYNHTLAKTLVEYASAVYMTDLTSLYTWTCSRCNDLTQGFEMRSLIVDVENCLQAFVGVAHNLNSIVVAIRGTQENSAQNWIKDLIWKQLDLSYPSMPNAKVHSGFFSSYNNTILRLAITSAVHKARVSYGDINVIVTGHSMGGAMASFCALDLAINLGSDRVQLMTFGQPRVGNAAFASYFAKTISHTWELTWKRMIGAPVESSRRSVKQFQMELASNILMTNRDVDVSIAEPSVQRDWSSSR